MRYQLPDYGSGFREGVEVKPYYEKDGITIYHGDCREILATLPANCVDSVVTDPPYGLKFMGKKWDYDVPGVEVWKEALRVLKPGGHLLIFAGTRTQHRMAVNIEDAGFEIRREDSNRTFGAAGNSDNAFAYIFERGQYLPF